MIEILLIFSLINFTICITTLGIALFQSHKNKALVSEKMCDAEVKLAGMEPRLEKYFEKMLHEQMTGLRAVVQEDALDIYHSLNSEKQLRSGGIDTASFRNL